jgi:phosphocarrier protein
MKSFEYTIKDTLGIHARPAGLLVKLSKSFESNITLFKGEESVDTRKLMTLMGLGITNGTKITLHVEGNDEDAAISALEEFFTTNL